MTRVISVAREEKDGVVVIRRTLLDEVFGRVEQALVVAEDGVARRTWFDRHYSEVSLKRVKTRDGRDAVDVVWGHEGEGMSNWYWTIIVPPDPQQIEQLFSAVRDHETFEEIISYLHSNCLAKNVNKVAECDIAVPGV
jgi:hypothetical protein